MPSGTSAESSLIGLPLRWTDEIRPRRDSAMVRPRWPRAASEIQASTMLRPVPRISTVASGSSGVSACGSGAHRDVLADDRLLLMADGKHCDVADQAGAVGKPDVDAGRRGGDRDAFLRDGVKPAVRAFGLPQPVEDAGEIVGIDVARHVDFSRVPVGRQSLPLQPAPEMLGVVGIGAHAEAR